MAASVGGGEQTLQMVAKLGVPLGDADSYDYYDANSLVMGCELSEEMLEAIFKASH